MKIKNENIKYLQNNNYEFKDINLLNEALTHTFSK